MSGGRKKGPTGHRALPEIDTDSSDEDRGRGACQREPKARAGALGDAADGLRLLRSLRPRPQFGISSAVGAVLFWFGEIPFGPTTYVGALAGGAKFRAAGNTEILELTRRDL
jgi:hypothetical protein